ncbi:MAG: hypothetical protein HYX54_03395 [Chloroflexi bacterium]|nr:hypothetical protein [Chloroflexota bacterium]
MPDQLSLRLEPALPKPPTTLRPMLARRLAEPFDSPDHLFEPSWGGLRVLAVVGPAATAGGGEVVFLSVDGVPLPIVPPELTGLGVRVAARSAVLDGELVVVNTSGTADPLELGHRLAGDTGRPVAFLAFDLLHLDGVSLLHQALDRRRDQLRRVLRPGDEVLTVPAIPGEGRALFDAVVEQGLAGVLARHRSGPYLCGIRSRLWRFIPSTTGAAQSGATGESGDRGHSIGATRSASGPVLAVIRRLPLGFEDLDPPPVEGSTPDGSAYPQASGLITAWRIRRGPGRWPYRSTPAE